MIVYEIPKSSPLYVKDNVFINFISDSLFVVLCERCDNIKNSHFDELLATYIYLINSNMQRCTVKAENRHLFKHLNGIKPCYLINGKKYDNFIKVTNPYYIDNNIFGSKSYINALFENNNLVKIEDYIFKLYKRQYGEINQLVFMLNDISDRVLKI